eukprot:Rhum_TRINITY_DN11341_c0_g2::Rhum_TRINITY_DN11341_c0_g2_i1::g.44038::m.44038
MEVVFRVEGCDDQCVAVELDDTWTSLLRKAAAALEFEESSIELWRESRRVSPPADDSAACEAAFDVRDGDVVDVRVSRAARAKKDLADMRIDSRHYNRGFVALCRMSDKDVPAQHDDILRLLVDTQELLGDPLVEAIRVVNCRVVDVLLEHGVDPSKKDENGLPAFHCLCRRVDREDELRNFAAVMSRVVDANATDAMDCSLTQKLLLHVGEDSLLPEAPATAAATSSSSSPEDQEAVPRLPLFYRQLQVCCRSGADLLRSSRLGRSLVQKAFWLKHPPSAAAVLGWVFDLLPGREADIINHVDQMPFGLWVNAAEKEDGSGVMQLFLEKAKIFAPEVYARRLTDSDSKGTPPILVAARCRNEETACLLLRHGAEPTELLLSTASRRQLSNLLEAIADTGFEPKSF